MTSLILKYEGSNGHATFENLPPRFVELTPSIRLYGRQGNTVITASDPERNFRLTIGMTQHFCIAN